MGLPLNLRSSRWPKVRLNQAAEIIPGAHGSSCDRQTSRTEGYFRPSRISLSQPCPDRAAAQSSKSTLLVARARYVVTHLLTGACTRGLP